MDNSLTSLIDSATSILVLLPTKPYFDQVAAGLSLFLALRENKEVAISCPSPMMVGFNRLVGIDKITSELGSKNLTIKFKGYDANNIEKVSYDIVQGEFNLTVVPKAGFSAPSKEQMDLNFSGVSADLVILIGGANDSHFPILESGELGSAKIVHIGNRVLSSNREVMSLAKPGATTSELVTSVIKENNMNIDRDIATNLLMGIEEGSSNFSSNEVTPDTFETFAFLLRSGGQRSTQTKLSPMNFPVGSIPTKPFIQSTNKQSAASNDVSKSAKDAQPMSQTMAAPGPEPIVEQVESKEEMVENPPDDWLQPKVYKGTSVS
jgi:nanoRNase/pAp phosphatase (c-di-AMP/oligoRNAs hydrolase)